MIDSTHDGMVLQQYVRQIRYLTHEIEHIDILLCREAAYSENAKLRTSLTGMGTYSALAIAVGIGSITRFANPKKLVSGAGLCPTVHRSVGQLYMGRMKKLDTNKMVNWIMCEAANTANDMRRE